MQKIVSVMILGFVAPAALATYFPVRIHCDDHLVPSTKLDIGISIANNEAELVYESSGLSETLHIFVDAGAGMNTSSGVRISSAEGGYGRAKTIQISASSYETYRATHYANFSVDLAQDQSGAFNATKLDYAKGTTEYPESQSNGSVMFDKLTCTLQGL